ncbi:MAG: hypothetical protein EPO51_17900 [Phenylobacterium sp.]|nr:MAG: hypothetical protein EPO51_17900 [Phenylobacterium sp.]
MTNSRNAYPSNPGYENEPSNWAKRQPLDGAFDVAGTAGWLARRSMQVNPQIERNFRSTIRGMFGSTFTEDEITKLQDRALDAAEMKDLEVLHGLEAGSPLSVTPAQKARIDRLVGKLGSDELGRKARDSYGKALSGGQIRTR